MTDIIESLRYYRMECGDFPALDVLMGEAADEIEKLRARAEKAEALILDMRQHQGSIQQYIKQIDNYFKEVAP